MKRLVDPLYDAILARARDDAPLRACCVGLTWSFCRTDHAIGFAQSSGASTRVLDFPGSLTGRPVGEVADWLTSWNPFEATVGLAAANAAINTPDNALMASAEILRCDVSANLAVFAHFRPRLVGRRVVVIGRYPGMDALFEGLDVTVIERNPGPGDLPDPAAEYLLPQADWVFLTATSLINKTFPRLAALAADAVTVLMGPSMPWLELFADYAVDFLAGVRPLDPARAAQIALEGGGTRLFGDGVAYALADIGEAGMAKLRAQIAQLAQQRAALNTAMQDWYAAGRRGRFDRHAELETVSERLSRLDTLYKRQWDARHG